MLSAEEMHELLAAIDTTSLLEFRDRALIALMGLHRVGAAIGMRVEDFYVQKHCGWVRLHENGGKINELPCYHNLDQYLEEWIAVSGLGSEPEARSSLPCVMDRRTDQIALMRWSGLLSELRHTRDPIPPRAAADSDPPVKPQDYPR